MPHYPVSGLGKKLLGFTLTVAVDSAANRLIIRSDEIGNHWMSRLSGLRETGVRAEGAV